MKGRRSAILAENGIGGPRMISDSQVWANDRSQIPTLSDDFGECKSYTSLYRIHM